MHHSRSRRVFLALLCLLPWAIPWSARSQDISADLITAVSLPNAVGAYGTTVLADISADGTMVGGFVFPVHGLQEGSFWIKPGLPPTIRLYTCGPEVTWTQVRAINIHTAQAGWCYTKVGDTATVDGFYRPEGGKSITRLRFPGATLTEATDLNDSHVVVGHYVDQQGAGHGFRWTRSTGKYETLDAPFPEATQTALFGINNAGAIVGLTFNASGPGGGGVLLQHGQWSFVTAPDGARISVSSIGGDGTILGNLDGQVLLRQGVLDSLTVPLPALWGANITSLNAAGVVVGSVDLAIPVTDETQGTPGPTYGFVTKLQNLQTPVGIPVVQAMATRQALRSSDTITLAAAPPPPQVQLDGCPDEPVPVGMIRPGKLAMSWAGCARMR